MLEEQLESLGRFVGSSGATRAAPGNGRRSTLKGTKVLSAASECQQDGISE